MAFPFARLIFIFLSLFITACTTPSVSDDPLVLWSEGQKKVEKGEQLVAKGDKNLVSGRNKTKEGESLIQGGSQRMIQARQDYQAAANSIGASSTPDQVDIEAKRLKSIGERWGAAIDDIKRGNKLVADGNKLIRKGQNQIAEGRRAIEAGSTMMRNSKRSELGVGLLPSPALVE